MMNAEFVDSIAELAQWALQSASEQHFLVGPRGIHNLTELADRAVAVEKLNLVTLGALGDYAKTLDPVAKDLFLVAAHSVANIVSGPNELGRRDVYASVIAPCHEIPHLLQLSQQDFRREVGARFVESTVRADLLELASALSAEHAAEFKDDGLSIETTLRRKGGAPKRESSSPIYLLQPWCTWPEIEQPTVTFRLQVHSTDDGYFLSLDPSISPLWKSEAARAAGDWLREQLPEPWHGRILT